MQVPKGKLTLDVGCGWHYKGDVNIDLFLGPQVETRTNEQEIYRNFKKTNQQIPNFINADCHYLPIKEATFQRVLCFHVLEHKGVSAKQVINEMMRVTKNEVIIKVPYSYPLKDPKRQSPLHDKAFHKSWFQQIFRNYPKAIRYSRYRFSSFMLPPKLHKYLHWVMNRLYKNAPFPFPTEITCHIWKNN